MNIELLRKMSFFFVIFIFSFTELPAQWLKINSGTTNSLRSIHFADYNIGFSVGEAGIILKSTNGGLTWQNISVPGSSTLHNVFVFNQNNAVIVGGSGIIMRTTNGGLNWTTVPSGVLDELYSVSFVDSFGICGGSSQTILYSTDFGASWNISQTGFFGGGFWGAFMLSPQIGFVAGENSIFQPMLGKTTNSGVSWDFTPFYLNNNEGRASGVDFTDLNTGYISSAVWDGRGAISKTTNSGIDWVTIFNNNPLWDIDFPISGASLIGYSVGESGTILKTYDAGTTWQTQQSGTQQSLNKVYFLDLDFGFAVGDSGIILKTTNGGIPVELTSFTATVNPFGQVVLNWITASEINNRIFEIERKTVDRQFITIGFIEGFGTTSEEQTYFYTDENINPGIYTYRLKQIDFDGTFEYSYTVEVTVSAPNEFSLSQNYPNPFNPSTIIKFVIPTSSFVNLKIYDVLSNEVATLVNEEKQPGVYEVEFSSNIQNLASGIYFYQLKAGDPEASSGQVFIQTKKMLMIK